VAAFEAATLDTVSAAGLVEDGLAVAPAAEVRGVDVFGATLNTEDQDRYVKTPKIRIKHRRSGSIALRLYVNHGKNEQHI